MRHHAYGTRDPAQFPKDSFFTHPMCAVWCAGASALKIQFQALHNRNLFIARNYKAHLIRARQRGASLTYGESLNLFSSDKERERRRVPEREGGRMGREGEKGMCLCVYVFECECLREIESERVSGRERETNRLSGVKIRGFLICVCVCLHICLYIRCFRRP